ncbi:transglutaminaseTgpA domain-containing protein [Sporolactobacillus sp. STCC-11]|uniref:transglutaminase TgpA family protein n=1 Tax=Sporolactobacillus caesalpiniae TaxID=3230362 RepID=UPI0033932EF1
MNERPFNRVINTIIYALAGFLLWLCAQPLIELTILNSKSLLVIFIAIMMLIFYLEWSNGLCAIVCGILILHAMHHYFFYTYPILSADWLIQLGEGISQNIEYLWHGQPAEESDLFSAFLFFLLFGLILFAIRYWIQKGRLVLFTSLAVLSGVLIDTFTVYDGSKTMIGIVVCALLLLSMWKWKKFPLKNTEKKELRSGFSWIAATSSIIAVIVVLALLMPKPESRWAASSDYLSGFGFSLFQNGSFFSGNQRIGYDDDDSRLGGSIGMDQTPLFTAAISGNPGYWRVAHKDHYTGRGWSNSEPFYLPASAAKTLASNLSLYEAQTKTNKQTAILHFSKASPAILPYSGEPMQITVPGKQLKIEQTTGQVLPIDEKRVSSEQLAYAEPVYQTSILRKATSESDPEIIREHYLQVPQDLPDRVRALGQRLTAGHTNRYDQVKAVVNYLRSSRFRYSTEQIPRPSQNQDYVDQFLFDSKVGYCDNFSTSMVVLLRSAGIPARWVKGFTSGEFQGQVQEKVNGKNVGLNQYQITNADAHSWGEVYFPGSGWVTFEPTPSFSDPSQFASASPSNDSEGSSSKQPSGSSERAQSQQDGATQQLEKQPADHSVNKASDQKKNASANNSPGVGMNWSRIGWITLIVLLIGTLAALVTRKKWLRAIYRWKIKKNPLHSTRDFRNGYRLLLRILALNGVKRSDTETLREFANRVCHQNNGNALLLLTECYERIIYMNDNQIPSMSAERFHTLADQLIADEPNAHPQERLNKRKVK